jgi:hypothetical protein
METNRSPLCAIGGVSALTAERASPPPPGAVRAIARSGMWSGVGFVGASFLAAGLQMLINGGVGAATALALVIGGGAVATLGWRSAWKALDAYDRLTDAATDPASPAPAPGRARCPMVVQVAFAVPPAAFAAR